MKLQLAFILARTQIPLEWLQPPSKGDAEIATDEELFDDLECLYNTKLIAHFRDFGKELGMAEAKSLKISINPIWKIPASCHYVQLFFILTPSLLHTGPGISANIDSARGNLAGTFVNAFVNAGFGNDKLIVTAEEGSSWIYKNKYHGM